MTDSSTGDKFREFYEHFWLHEDVYVQTDFVKYFNIDSRLARYHLLRMCDEGLLTQISYKGNAWYIHQTHRELFKQNLSFNRRQVRLYPR